MNEGRGFGEREKEGQEVWRERGMICVERETEGGGMWKER